VSVSVSDLRVEEEEEGWQGVDGVVRGEGNHVRYALEGLRTRGRAGQGPVGNEDEDVDFGVCGDVVDAVDDDGLVDVMMGGDEAEGRGEDGGQQPVNARQRHLLVQVGGVCGRLGPLASRRECTTWLQMWKDTLMKEIDGDEEGGAAELLSLGKEDLLNAVHESLSTAADARREDGDGPSLGEVPVMMLAVVLGLNTEQCRALLIVAVRLMRRWGLALPAETQELTAVLEDGGALYITGEGGTGKSVVVRSMVLFARLWGRESHVVLTGTTGVAASQFECGATLHSTVGLERKETVREASTAARWDKVRRSKVLVIDEVSMLSAKQVTALDLRLRMIRAGNGGAAGDLGRCVVCLCRRLLPAAQCFC